MNNPNLTINGSGDFSLIIDATAAPVDESSYDAAAAMFGNVTKVTVKNEFEAKDHFGSYRGLRVLDKRRVTKVQKGYMITTDEFDIRAIRSVFFAEQGADAGTSPDYHTFVPFSAPQGLRGFARLRMWDVEDRTNPRLIHKDFYCVVTPDGDVELAEEDATLTLRIDVLSPVGTVFLKQSS